MKPARQPLSIGETLMAVAFGTFVVLMAWSLVPLLFETRLRGPLDVFVARR